MSRPCSCGSGEPRREVNDARGIFVSYVCDKCEKEKLKGYRREIFVNPRYWTSEQQPAKVGGLSAAASRARTRSARAASTR